MKAGEIRKAYEIKLSDITDSKEQVVLNRIKAAKLIQEKTNGIYSHSSVDHA